VTGEAGRAPFALYPGAFALQLRKSMENVSVAK
jgi:hypothetical protein